MGDLINKFFDDIKSRLNNETLKYRILIVGENTEGKSSLALGMKKVI